MQLTMTVLRCPDAVPPETRTISGGEFSVGRGPGVDWVLPDTERLLSKRHFAVAYRGGVWQLADTSTNGTFLNRDTAPLGNGEMRNLRDGDRVRLGAYEIEIRLAEEDFGRAGSASLGGQSGASPFGDPFGMDPFGPARPAPTPFNDPLHGQVSVAPTTAQLPHDFDPLAPEPGNAAFHGPTQSDHSSVMDDAFHAPAITGQTPMHAGGIIPGDDLLPDDWDKDLLEGISPPAATPAAAPAAQPPVHQPPPRPVVAPPPPAPPVARASPPEPVPVPPEPSPFAEHFAAPAAPVSPPPEASPFDEPPAMAQVMTPPAPVVTAPPPIARTTPTPPPPEPAVEDSALLAAFLEGVGLPDAHPKDPTAMMLALGKAFRTLVAGLRAVLIARASIKSEFRIEQTMIRARGNNPLKFSAGDDDALTALLGTGRRIDMTPPEAVADALRDIRLHELASIAAMQSAVRAMLDGLEPAKLRAAAEQGGGMTLLPAQKKARAWDAYEALHARTVQALSDDFDSAFGKAFARAYERALDEVSAKEHG